MGRRPTGPLVPAVSVAGPAALVARLDEIADRDGGGRTPLGFVTDEVLSIGWVGASRLSEVLGGGD